ncbi:SAVED domain-containing protein [Persephonella sp.]|uniref:SAVED domain-containing protein n=1 Tax=Persephonella sp. TaxID=2060922 RepID=UPI00260510F9|nr:SAVED domain-containing protein [Persephonella sp.]
MIKQLYKNSPDILVKAINEDSIKDKDVDQLYDLLKDYLQDNELTFAIYKFFDRNPEYLDCQKFSKSTGLSVQVVKEIFNTRPTKVYFPLANHEYSDIASAYVFSLKSKTEKFSFSNKSDLIKIKDLLKNKGIKKNFFVIFDKNFTQRSYLLSVACAFFLSDYVFDSYAFTGEINSEGEIFDVGFIRQKEKITKEKGLRLISPKDADHIDEIIYYLGEEPIDIPFLQLSNKTEEEALISIEKLSEKIKEKSPFFNLKKLEKFFNINREDILLITGFLPQISKEDLKKENEWIKTIKTFEEKLKNIYSKISRKKRILHIASSVSSLAFGMGIKFGAKKPVVIYHYQADEYFPVIDLSDDKKIRQIKQVKKEINLLEAEYLKKSENSRDLAVAIWIASHNLFGDVLRFCENKSCDVIGIKLKDNQGNLPVSNGRLWVDIVNQIYSVLNQLKNQKYERLHFFISSPVAISFALGMSVGHFINGTVYNKNNQYFPVFEVEDSRMRSIF